MKPKRSDSDQLIERIRAKMEQSREIAPSDDKFTHTQECRDAQAWWEREKAQYKAKWPNYCRKCDGWGYVGAYGDPDSCPECYDKDRCPRCGGQFFENEHADRHCFDCGFNDDLETDGIPPMPDCCCPEPAWMHEE